MGNILQMRKEAVPFLESLGIPKPRSKAEWSYIFKEMGTFLAAKNFIVNCPLPVMELPVAPVHDSKEALRFRAVCDERITLPLSSLRAFDSVYTKLVAGLSNKESDPKAKILAGADTTLRTPDQGTRRYPPITTSTVTAVAGKKYINKHFSTGTKHVFWASVECGLVLPSISAWEVVGKEKFKTTGGYTCRFCKGFCKASRGDPAAPNYGVAQGQGHLPAAGDGRARSSYIISGSGTGWSSTSGWSRQGRAASP